MSILYRTLNRLIIVDFNTTCVANNSQQLILRIGPPNKQVPSSSFSRVIELDVLLLTQTTKLNIRIIGRAFHITDPNRSIVVSLSEKVDTEIFDILPEQYGQWELTIEVSHDKKVVRFRIPTLVQKRNPESVQLISEKINLSSITAHAKADLTIKCVKEKDGTLSYSCRGKRTLDMDGGKTEREIADEDIIPYFNMLTDYTKTVLDRDLSYEEFISIYDRFKGFGKFLYQSLITTELRYIVSGIDRGSRIDITTGEDWIPWELIYDDQDFWGMKYDLRRFPSLKPQEVEKVYGNRPQQQSVDRRSWRIINVVGHRLGSAEQRGRETFKSFSNTVAKLEVIPLIQPTIAELKKDLTIHGQVDILHITCHGILSNIGYYLDLGSGPARRLDALNDIINNVNCELVFVNACGSASVSRELGAFISFGKAFYKAGVRVFIGTILPVPPFEALSFAEKFYEKWLQNSENCGQMLLQTKNEMADSLNPFWLFYCLYGDD